MTIVCKRLDKIDSGPRGQGHISQFVRTRGHSMTFIEKFEFHWVSVKPKIQILMPYSLNHARSRQTLCQMHVFHTLNQTFNFKSSLSLVASIYDYFYTCMQEPLYFSSIHEKNFTLFVFCCASNTFYYLQLVKNLYRRLLRTKEHWVLREIKVQGFGLKPLA